MWVRPVATRTLVPLGCNRRGLTVWVRPFNGARCAINGRSAPGVCSCDVIACSAVVHDGWGV